MITDEQTNSLYLSDVLPVKFPEFHKSFEKVLIENDIKFALLPGTKDIWAVDYMPVQVSKTQFINFKYDPDYLQTKKWLKTISDAESICMKIGIPFKNSGIKLDGGNVIRFKNKAILCDKVFVENPDYSENSLIYQLKDLLQVKKLIFIPQDKNDIVGHADGMVRFINENTVLINDYSKEDKNFQRNFRNSLRNAGLDLIELPYNPYMNKNDEDATGVYINYLQMKNFIAFPIFNLPEADEALKIMKNLFPEYNIVTVNCTEIAKHGGVLNCISWNILAQE